MTITKRFLDYDELNFHIKEKYDILATTYELQHADDIIVENEQTD